MKNIRNLVAAALCFGVSFSVLGPAVANPFDGVCDLSGDGLGGDPHLLNSEADLIGMQDCTVIGTTHYALGGDIFISAGVGDFFRDAYFDDDVDVSLDGRGFGIYGLRFGDPLGRNVGLFGQVDDLTVRNITLQAGLILFGPSQAIH